MRYIVDACSNADDSKLIIRTWGYDLISQLYIWDTTSGILLKRLDHCGTGTMAIDKSGTRITTTESNNKAYLFDASSGTKLGKIEHPNIYPNKRTVLDAAFNFDGTHVITSSDDKTAKVW